MSGGNVVASRVCAMGCGHDGRLGISKSESNRHLATPVPFFDNRSVLRVHTGGFHSMVECTDGLYAFGEGEHGQLGVGVKGSVMVPQRLEHFQLNGRIKDIEVSMGEEHTLVVEEGTLYAFGRNKEGQLGVGGDDDAKYPTEVTALRGKRIRRVAAGSMHSLAWVEEDGVDVVYSWGLGDNGQLGYTGDAMDAMLAKQTRIKDSITRRAAIERLRGQGPLPSDLPVPQSEVGEYNPALHPSAPSAATLSTFFAPFSQRTPQKVPFPFGEVLGIEAGWHRSVVYTADGVYSFGCSFGSQRETYDNVTPTLVTPPLPDLHLERVLPMQDMWVAMASNIDGDLSVWSKGEGAENGELGLGEEVSCTEEWRKVAEVPRGTVLSARSRSAALVLEDGNSVMAFGDNYFGQLGVGHDRPVYTPTRCLLPSRLPQCDGDLRPRVRSLSMGWRHCLLLVDFIRDDDPSGP